MQPRWKYIYTVYQCGSFSAAENFLTQPALSVSVQKQNMK